MEITLEVCRGHLVVEDGVGRTRRAARLARVGHDLRRLIVVGSDGQISLSAIRWLADLKAALVMLDRNGTVLVATGPTSPRDARLRRAQAVAHHTGAAVPLIRELLHRKLTGQEQVARTLLQDSVSEHAIREARSRTMTAETVDALRLAESQAAMAYWAAWRGVPVHFPKVDTPRVPDHWRVFGTRRSPLTGSPRLATSPPNALLNYLYAILEAESRLAAVAVGLDPAFGFLHADSEVRDSLACDLMEVVRPQVDAYLLKWLLSEPLRREWFFEDRNGNCRLMPVIIERLSQTASVWARAVAPIAEYVATSLWAMARGDRNRELPTRLTQTRRRIAQGGATPKSLAPATPPRVCSNCGDRVSQGYVHCARCDRDHSPERMRRVAIAGRVKALKEPAQRKRADTRKRIARAIRGWDPASLPTWLTADALNTIVVPRLKNQSVKAIASAMKVCESYAANVRTWA